MGRKCISIFLAICLVIQLVPAIAFAETGSGEAEEIAEREYLQQEANLANNLEKNGVLTITFSTPIGRDAELNLFNFNGAEVPAHEGTGERRMKTYARRGEPGLYMDKNLTVKVQEIGVSGSYDFNYEGKEMEYPVKWANKNNKAQVYRNEDLPTETIFNESMTLEVLNVEYRQINRNEDGEVTSKTVYDKWGRMIEYINALGYSMKGEYTTDDGHGSISRETDALGNVTSYEYEEIRDERKRLVEERLVKRIYPDGTTDEYEYDDDGRLILHLEPSGLLERYEYDDKDQLISTQTYDENGKLVKEVKKEYRLSVYTRDVPEDKIKVVEEEKVTVAGYNTTVTEVEYYADKEDEEKIRKGELEREKEEAYRKNNLTRKTDGNRNAITQIYEEGNLICVYYDGNNLARMYQYDEYDNLIREQLYDAVKKKYESIEENSYEYYPIEEKGDKEKEWEEGEEETEEKPKIKKMTKDHGNGSVNIYEYDENENLIKHTNPKGGVTHYQYDEDNRLVKETSPLGNETIFEYDLVGQVIGIYDAAGGVVNIEYDGAGRQISQSISGPDMEPVKVTMEYDCMGRHRRTRDEKGKVLEEYLYDSGGNIVAHMDQNGHTTRYSYDILGNVISTTDPGGNTQTCTYDVNGNLMSTTDPRGVTASLRYDKNGNVVEETDSNGNVKTFIYDRNNRQTSVTAVIEGEEVKTQYEYDIYGNVNLIKLPNGGQVSFLYDKNGNLLSSTDALGKNEVRTYDALGNLTSVTDRNGNITGYDYDIEGRLICETNAKNTRTTYQYDGADRVVLTTVAADGEEISYRTQYDGAGRVILEANPLATEEGKENKVTYQYDERGRIAKKIYEDGESYTSYAYDGKDNVLSESYVSGGQTYTYTYSYNMNDQVTKAVDPLGGETIYQYNPAGLLETETDPQGNVTTYTYDGKGNVIAVRDSLGEIATYVYDARDKVIRQTDANENVTEFEYDANGNLTKVINPDKSSITYEYDLANQLTKVIDSDNNEILYEYDANGNRTKVTDAKGNATIYEYDSLNQKVGETDALKNQREYVYDGFGRLVAEKDEDGKSTTYGYDALGRLVAKSDACENFRGFVYDAMGNVIEESNGRAIVKTCRYDGLGNVIEETDAQGYVATYEYDLLGNCLKYTDKRNNLYGYSYDYMNRITSVTDPKGNAVNYQYDFRGNLIKEVDAKGNVTEYKYDGNGNVTETINSEGTVSKNTYDSMNRTLTIENHRVDRINHVDEWQITRYMYNNAGLVAKEINPQGKEKSYEYDENGNLTCEISEDGKKTIFEYSPLNLVTKISYSDGKEVNYEYDGTGALTEMTDWNGTIDIEVDAVDRIRSVTDHNDRKVEYRYDGAGNLSNQIYPDGREVSYQYDRRNNLTIAKETIGEEIRVTAYEYDENGNVTKKIYPSQESTTYKYDSLGYPERMNEYDRQGRLLQVRMYAYDANGNRTETAGYSFEEGSQVPTDWVNERYSYDSLNRMVTSSEDKEETEYTYDTLGNLVQETTDRGTITYRYNNLNQLLQKEDEEGITEYEYDARGNRILKIGVEGTYKYYYDSANRLEEGVTPTGESSVYVYNGLGMRVSNIQVTKDSRKPVTEEYVIDYTSGENNDLCVYSTSEKGQYVDSYIYAGGEQLYLNTGKPGKETQTYYIHEDVMGSASYLTEEDGTVCQRIEYDVWGLPQEAKTTAKNNILDISFTGHSYDDVLGIYFAEARFYDPESRVFISEDPIKDGDNWYQYCNSNPATYWDPTGLFWSEVIRAFGYGMLRSEVEEIEYEEEIEWLANNPELTGEIVTSIGCFVLTTILCAAFPAAALLIELGFTALESGAYYCFESSMEGKKIEGGKVVKEMTKGVLTDLAIGAGIGLLVGGVVVTYKLAKAGEALKETATTADNIAKAATSIGSKAEGARRMRRPVVPSRYENSAVNVVDMMPALAPYQVQQIDLISVDISNMLGSGRFDGRAFINRVNYNSENMLEDADKKIKILMQLRDGMRNVYNVFNIRGEERVSTLALKKLDREVGGVYHESNFSIELDEQYLLFLYDYGINEMAETTAVNPVDVLYHELGHHIEKIYKDDLFDVMGEICTENAWLDQIKMFDYEAWLRRSRHIYGKQVSEYAYYGEYDGIHLLPMFRYNEGTDSWWPVENFIEENRDREYFAESFVLYMKGEWDRLDPLFVNLLNKLKASNHSYVDVNIS